VSAVALHHEVSGPAHAPVLLLGASLGTTLALWPESQLRALEERMRVVRFDARGHGRSPAPPGPYEIADLGGDVLALMSRLGIERASYCGVSIGGMVGMWLAAQAPERIERLVLICTSPHVPPASRWAERAAAVLAAGTTETIADEVVGRWVTPAFASRHPDVVSWLRAMLLSAPPEGYAACCGAIERMDLRADLAAIRAPTLVVAGADDQAIPPDHGRAIAAAVSGARLEVLPRAAHLANVEHAGDVARLILTHCVGAVINR
jgi:3-oxoadipate enol-lactonase